MERCHVNPQQLEAECLRLLAMDPQTRGIKRAEIIACTLKERGRIAPTARLIRCRRERASPLPKRLLRRSMEDGRCQINALMQPSLVGGRINHHMLG
jgi:hypothetical protein